MCELEDEKYEFELKIRKQDFEVSISCGFDSLQSFLDIFMAADICSIVKWSKLSNDSTRM
jgi:hypothetical protein